MENRGAAFGRTNVAKEGVAVIAIKADPKVRNFRRERDNSDIALVPFLYSSYPLLIQIPLRYGKVKMATFNFLDNDIVYDTIKYEQSR